MADGRCGDFVPDQRDLTNHEYPPPDFVSGSSLSHPSGRIGGVDLERSVGGARRHQPRETWLARRTAGLDGGVAGEPSRVDSVASGEQATAVRPQSLPRAVMGIDCDPFRRTMRVSSRLDISGSRRNSAQRG